jgi:hypothetical protein
MKADDTGAQSDDSDKTSPMFDDGTSQYSTSPMHKQPMLAVENTPKDRLLEKLERAVKRQIHAREKFGLV